MMTKSSDEPEVKILTREELRQRLQVLVFQKKEKRYNQESYPSQLISVVAINGYVYLVPYVESKDGIFLKTIIPSRNATKLFIGA